MNDLDIIKMIVAFVPVIWLLLSIGKLKITAHKASGIALVLTIIGAFAVFKMPISLIFQASQEGVMLAFCPILFVIINALFVYNITKNSGNMNIIRDILSSVSADRRIQTLILAFSFGGFLEAVAGFGTAVAIPAGIMAAMGFEPLMAATICLIANTVPVAFGVLGVPVITLAQITSLPLRTISIFTAVQLIPFVIFLPLVLIITLTKSIKRLKGVVSICISSGLIFALGQMATTVFVGPELAAVVGSMASLILVITWVKIRPIKDAYSFNSKKEVVKKANHITKVEALVAWSPYILILFFIFATRLIPIFDFLNEYPFTIKKQFYFGEGGKPILFQFGNGAATILLISAFLGGIIQGLSIRKVLDTLFQTIISVKKVIVTVVSIVALAKIMGYCGMIGEIAIFFVLISGRFFPLISPLIGALGTFITGSDTSSNVLFGNLQKQVAQQLNINAEWIVAANASGATAGKMISPQSISIAIAAAGISGSEGKILITTIKYCIVYVLLLGLFVLLFQKGFIV